MIRGTAADIQKMSLLRLSKRLRKVFGDLARICMHTHDSNVVLVHKSVDVRKLKVVVTDAMVFKIPMRVQMKVSHSIGFRLGSMVELDANVRLDFDAREVLSGKAVDVEVENDTAVSSSVEDKEERLGSNFVIKAGPTFSVMDATKLKALLESFPGGNIVTLRTEKGDLPLVNFKTSLTVSDVAKFQLIIPCELVVDVSNVDMETLGVQV